MNKLVSTLMLIAGFAVFGNVLLVGKLTAQTDLAALVKQRQELMSNIGKTFRPMVAIMKDESKDLDAAGAAAQTMHDSFVKAVGLFPEGSAKGDIPGSRAKPEVWAKAADFKLAADTLIAETAKLAAAAKTGDIDAFKAQFGPTAKACGGCHEGPGDKGGKFRAPKEG